MWGRGAGCGVRGAGCEGRVASCGFRGTGWGAGCEVRGLGCEVCDRLINLTKQSVFTDDIDEVSHLVLE